MPSMTNKRFAAIVLSILLLLVGCNIEMIPPPTNGAPTPTREINYPTDVPATPVATEAPHVWLPGVNCDDLADNLRIELGNGAWYLNGNPCIQQISSTDENGVIQVYPAGYEIVSEPGLTESGNHALIWFDPDQKAMVIKFTDGIAGGQRVNGMWGWRLRGQHVPANTCVLIKITGQSFLGDFHPDRDPVDQIIKATVDNGIEEQIRMAVLGEYGQWEESWAIYSSNQVNVFDATFQVGQTWATAGGYVEIWSLQIFTAPDHCNGNGVLYF